MEKKPCSSHLIQHHKRGENTSGDCKKVQDGGLCSQDWVFLTRNNMGGSKTETEKNLRNSALTQLPAANFKVSVIGIWTKLNGLVEVVKGSCFKDEKAIATIYT